MVNKKRKIRKSSLKVVLLSLCILIPIIFISFSAVKSYMAGHVSEEPSPKNALEKEDQSKESSQSNKTEAKEEEPEVIEEEEVIEQVPALPEGKIVYLTFDDGPSQYTETLLSILKEHDVSATFFMQGVNLQKDHLQEHVKRAVEEGHYIGAHSMTHDFNKLYKQNQFVPEMLETLQLIADITGTDPKLTRPPYGSAPGLNSEKSREPIVESDIKVWDWTIDSKDWALSGQPGQIVQNVKNETSRDTEVVLMHEKQQTIDALPDIIRFYKEQGYSFVAYHPAHHFSINFQYDDRL